MSNSLTTALSEFWAPTDGKPHLASQADKDIYLTAKSFFENLQLPAVVTGDSHQKVIVVNFDGTGNNRYTLPDEESNISLIDKQLDAAGVSHFYQIGIGTTGTSQTSEQALAARAEELVQQALESVAETVKAWKDEDPQVSPYIIVTGFSRGAAEARAFMTFIDKYGIPSADDTIDVHVAYNPQHSQLPSGTVHMSALLFDTVDTGMFGDFESIPDTVDSLVHITSRDERRELFPLTSVEAGPGLSTNRIIEVQLPGVHSDIGGGYVESERGVANLTLYFSQLVLAKWGVPITATLPDLFNSATWIEHDSRTAGTNFLDFLGLLETTARPTTYVAPETVIDGPQQSHLSKLYANTPGGWAGAIKIPVEIQSPAQLSNSAPALQSVINSFSVLETQLSDVFALMATQAGRPAGGTWVDGYDNSVTLTLAESLFAATSVFSNVWGLSAFSEDASGNILFSGESNFANAYLDLERLYHVNEGQALNTTALLARAVQGFNLQQDSKYLELVQKLTTLDGRFAYVFDYYSGGSGHGNVGLANAFEATVITGGPGNDALFGFAGDDTLSGGGGMNYLDGGAGKNTYYTGPVGDQVVLSGESDTVIGGGGVDTIHVTSQNATVLIQEGNSSFDLHLIADSSGSQPWVRFEGENLVFTYMTGGTVTVAGAGLFAESNSVGSGRIHNSDGTTSTLVQSGDGIASLSKTNADGSQEINWGSVDGSSGSSYTGTDGYFFQEAHAQSGASSYAWRDAQGGYGSGQTDAGGNSQSVSHFADGTSSDAVYLATGFNASWTYTGPDPIAAKDNWLTVLTPGAHVTIFEGLSGHLIFGDAFKGETLTAEVQGNDLLIRDSHGGSYAIFGWEMGYTPFIQTPDSKLWGPSMLKANITPTVYGWGYDQIFDSRQFSSIVDSLSPMFAAANSYFGKTHQGSFAQYVWDAGIHGGGAYTGNNQGDSPIFSYGWSFRMFDDQYIANGHSSMDQEAVVWGQLQYDFWQSKSGWEFALTSVQAGHGGQSNGESTIPQSVELDYSDNPVEIVLIAGSGPLQLYAA